MRKWYATNCGSAINAAATPEAAKRDEKQDSLKRNALFENTRGFLLSHNCYNGCRESGKVFS
jgi:hypothetical protein